MSPPRSVPVTPEEMAASLATSARILASAIDRLDTLTTKVDALVTKLAGLERDQNRHELDPLGHRQSRVR